MFSSSHPPLLVLPVSPEMAANFPKDRGYNQHPLDDKTLALSYMSGWTFPLSIEQREHIKATPLLLVRNKGGVTSEGSTFIKGYAHSFIRSDGQPPESVYNQAIFLDKPNEKWMLVPDRVNVVWLQCGYKNQYLGDLGNDMEKYHYGKLMILNYTIEMDIAPRLDRKADVLQMREIQYRVHDKQLLNASWSRVDDTTQEYLYTLLSEHGLEGYKETVSEALHRAGFRD